MGQYNPHAPYIIGQEWVPIRNAFYVPDGIVERGYTFTLNASTVPVSGAFYVEEIPDNHIASSCDMISVYPAGRETLSGPIKKVNIPASAVTVNNPGSIDISAGVAALANPEDGEDIIFEADPLVNSELWVSFNTSAFAQLLLGKRILDLRVRYQLSSPNVANSERFSIAIDDTSNSSFQFPRAVELTSSSSVSKVASLSATEMNPFWDSTAIARGQRTILPWRFQELNRFRSGASPALVVSIGNQAVVSNVFLGFMDLEVIYCEETRVLYGGFKTYDTSISNTPTVLTEFYNVGAIATRLYNPVTFTQGNTLPSGSYVVTIYHRDMSSSSHRQGAPSLHALREYYQLEPQRGVHVNQTLRVDDEFTSNPTDVLTQITLHTATQVVTGVHPYGTQYGAPIYGTRTAIQEIEDDPGSSAQYPQVRFYARRYGNTTVPLTLVDTATGLNTVSISVADFDALTEIVDGWREVTLRFATPPTFPPTSDDVDWRWQASGELVGSQWQIMVASGPSGSWNPNPTAASTGPATYWSPQGGTVGLTWQSPTISGSAFDSTSDAVLIFSQDPPTVTGLGITIDEQQLDAATSCAVTPRCVPTGLDYVALTWNPLGVCDDFARGPLSGTWDGATTGQTWTLAGGVIASDYAVTDEQGRHNLGTVSVSRNSTITVGFPLSLTNARVDVSVSEIATGDSIVAGPGIGINFDNMYQTRLQFLTSGTVVLEIIKRLGGAQASLGTVTLGGYLPNVAWTIETLWRIGGYVEARAWPSAGLRPESAQLFGFDRGISSFPSVILRSVLNAGNTNVNPVVMFDNLTSTTDQLRDGSLELQRRDPLDDWQTVMMSTRPGCVISFNDYEARVGQLSEYRLRTLNALDFAGPWVTGSATVPTPGVTVGGSGNSVLIFTSNEDPSANLAYVIQHEGQAIETFSFPEVDTVSLQRLFGRDFFLAVRPLERGGERFSRVLLVNNAAISLPSLANFRQLRDLAWADLSYVCVRDELGNRWLATVIVPDAAVRGNRTIYLARIEVVEVTNTASQVDP